MHEQCGMKREKKESRLREEREYISSANESWGNGEKVLRGSDTHTEHSRPGNQEDFSKVQQNLP